MFNIKSLDTEQKRKDKTNFWRRKKMQTKISEPDTEKKQLLEKKKQKKKTKLTIKAQAN